MSCESCPFKEDCISGPISGRWVGPEDGKPIMAVVGESPTLGDDQKEKVFTGQRGHLVHDVIRSISPTARVFYTNIIACRVVDGSTISDENISNCMAVRDFEETLISTGASMVIALGNNVLKTLTKHSGISTYRGTEQHYHGMNVLPTYSPGAVLRSPKYSTPFKADIIKATLIASGNTSKYEYEYIPVMTKESVREMIRTLTDLKNHSKIEYMSLDFETTTYDYWRPETKIMTMGICADGHTCYGIPIDHPQSPWRNQGQILMNMLRPFLCDLAIPVVGNNWKYDQKWSRAKLNTTVNFGPDNELISYACDENTPNGLKYNADVICSSGHYDAEIVWPKEFDPVRDDITKKVNEYLSMDLRKLMKYNALDAFYSWNIYPVLRNTLHEDVRMERIYKYLLEAGSHMFVRIEEQGMWIDPERMAEAHQIVEENLNKAKAHLDSLLPEGWVERNLSKKQLKEGFNWNSTKQLGQLFFQEDGYNFPILAKTDKGAPSTSESTIINLSSEIEHPALDGLLDYRKWAKYMNTYILPWTAKLDENSRLHPKFKLDGTVTGRLSGEDGVHQVPKDNLIRRIIGAPPGWSFLEIDGSQIELRVVAAVANERTMLRIYATNGDIHKTTAAKVMRTTPDKVKGSDRKKAKAVNFGFVYGMGHKKFKVYSWEKYGIRITAEEAKQFRDDFFELYHDLPAWHARMRSLVRKLGYVVSPIGRKRRLPDIFSSDEKVQGSAEREAINSPVQGFGSDYVLAAFIDMFKIIEREDHNFETIRPVGTVHDAQYYEIRNDMVDYWAPKIKKNFDDPTRLKDWFNYVPPVLIPGDCKIGNHWGDAQDWDIGQPFPHEMR